MQLKPEEISKIIRAQIKHYENVIEQSEVGTVIMVGDGIARASGLEKCMAGELLQFDNGEYGMAQNLEENTVSIVLLGSDVGIKEGSTVKRTGKVVSVPVGEAMIGRVVNALGQPIDGAGPIETTEFRAIESPAPGIIDRQPVKEPLQTGIKAIDSMIPIGRGQRELIIGDRQTGNTETLARHAAKALPAGTEQTWLHLTELELPPFVDRRHTSGTYPMPTGDLKTLLDATLAATDLVFVSPVYWFSIPAALKTYLDHWSAWMRVPGLDFKARMTGKRLWVISTSGGCEKAQAMFDSYRLCAEFLGLDFQTPLWGKGGAPGTVLADAEALAAAARHFGPRAE